MRKTAAAAVMVVCLAGLLLAGCGDNASTQGGGGNGGGDTTPPPPRDTSTLESALLGHWRDTAGNELYFGPDTVTFVAAETGEEHASGYVIVAKDENIKRIDLEFTQPGDVFYAADPSRNMYATVFFRRPGMEGLIFGADFFSREAESRLNLTETEYPYVDAAQEP